ncbi:Plectin/S10 domain-containing protein [Pelagophyceae sp. CCMP2097]|nr:Plectin/S10 domain-containing protein [Pelagophyceae sp. CCMP2097]|mmetsp:Transcript_10122/g.33456  ORF Transcript_10122/g.33456 Transcript_10122/m.33456 type:complete len:164 (-) Transcript_10122:154-645(-)
MFIPKKNRIEVYSYLFKEGVLVAKKDGYKPKHDDIDVPNLEVLNIMKSMKSRGYVRETFNWQFYYWYLEEDGIEYLRNYLHLPAEIVPATLKKASARPVTSGRAPPPGTERDDGREPREGGFGREGGFSGEGGRGGGRGFGGGRGGEGGGFGRGFGRGRGAAE